LMVMLRPLPTLPPPLLALAVPLGAVAVTVLPVMWVFLIVSIPPVPTPAESAHAQAVDAAGTVALTWLLLTVLSATASWPSSQVPPQKATASPRLFVALTLLSVIVLLRIVATAQRSEERRVGKGGKTGWRTE